LCGPLAFPSPQKEISNTIDVNIINRRDALEFILAGACMIQVGCANFVDPQTSIKIVDGLRGYLKEKKLTRIDDLVGKLETD
jgi:dihydroorotate dehydrogenase (NAD+) catalytic subunit